MEIWGMWTALIENCIALLTSQVGISEAVAIIVFTLAARMALMPISFSSAHKMVKNKLAMNALKPELESLRERYGEDPAKLARETMALYKQKGVKFLDRTTLLNMGSQGVLGLGLFQALKEAAFHSKWLWIADIAKPDVLLAVFVGLLTFLSMLIMPGAEHSSLLLFAIPAVVSVFVLISFPSAVAIYWASSNFITIGQTVVLRYVISKQRGNTPGV